MRQPPCRFGRIGATLAPRRKVPRRLRERLLGANERPAALPVDDIDVGIDLEDARRRESGAPCAIPTQAPDAATREARDDRRRNPVPWRSENFEKGLARQLRQALAALREPY